MCKFSLTYRIAIWVNMIVLLVLALIYGMNAYETILLRGDVQALKLQITKEIMMQKIDNAKTVLRTYEKVDAETAARVDMDTAMFGLVNDALDLTQSSHDSFRSIAKTLRAAK